MQSLKQIKEKVPEVRILDSTYGIIVNEAKKMIGGEFEVMRINYYDKTIYVWNKDKSNWWIFNLSDVQFLTPLSFNGRRIGIGDEVKDVYGWCEVYGYSWNDGEWGVDVAENKDYKDDTRWLTENKITDLRPLYQDDKVQKAINLLQEKGRIKDGKIII